MDKQAVFNQVITHLAKQGKPASNGAGSCMYRDGELRCAIGSLIKDEFYSPALERHSIHDSKVKHAVEQSLGVEDFSYQDEKFLAELQYNLHDEYANKYESDYLVIKDKPTYLSWFIERAHMLALKYGLELSIPA